MPHPDGRDGHASDGRVILFRHANAGNGGETRFKGCANPPLSRKGEREARAIARSYNEWPIGRIISSPLIRAIQTIKPLADKRGLTIETEDSLKDLDFGEWEGKTLKEVQAFDPRRFALWKSHPDRFVFPNGLVLADYVQNSLNYLEKIVLTGPRGINVAVCAHRALIKGLVCHFSVRPLSDFWSIQIDPAAATMVLWNEGRWMIEIINDTRHLHPISDT